MGVLNRIPVPFGPYVLLLPLFLLPCPLIAASSDGADVNEVALLSMSVGLFGGLAIFLYGMEKMSIALEKAAGKQTKKLLARLTSNRIMGVITGTSITAVIQSSSVTTVLVVGFISSGVMSLSQSVGVIMGANIGTTVTGQIIAFKVTNAALAMVAIGFLVQFVSKRDYTKHYANILFGLGLIFLGMNLMSEAMAPLRDYQPFIQAMAKTNNVLLAILIAAFFTALVQSSSATTGIVIVFASQGFISLEAGIALAMGANLGTCVTALLAAIGKSREAMQAAGIHILFNLIGVIIWLPFITELGRFSVGMSPSYPYLSGAERLASELPRQIANANTVFNLLNTIIMLPFATLFITLVKKIVPHKIKTTPEIAIKPKYLNKALLKSPDIALDQAQLELGRLGRRVSNMMNMLPRFAGKLNQDSIVEQEKARAQLNQIKQLENEVDQLHAEILGYLGQLRTHPLSEMQSRQQIKLISITDQLESIADMIVDSLVPLEYKAANAGISVSPEMRETLDTIQDSVNQAMLNCVNSIRRGDDLLAKQVLRAKRDLNSQLNTVLTHQAKRLADRDPNRLRVFRYEMEWVESLKRIYSLSRRIAKLQLRRQLDG